MSGPAAADPPVEIIESIETPLMRARGAGRVERLRVGSGVSVEEAVAALQSDPRVSVAEPNWIFQSTAVSNDPLYQSGGTWGMYSSDLPAPVGPTGTTSVWGSHAEQVWNNDVTGKSTVFVGVIDQGIQITHPDLINNIWFNPYETAGDGIDNDGNGYVDDVNGWDFLNNDNSVYDGSVESHGTHVAGTIGAEGGNGQGVAGVAWDVTMIPLKFMGASGGTTANAIRALDYLTDLKVRHGLNIVASNNSWGGGAYSRLLHEAIIRGANRDILFVAAAGNATSNNDTVASYPANFNTSIGTPAMAAASYDAVISVAAITETGGLASFSNTGATTVDIGAPGNSILSTVPGGYGTRNGTSMAAPHVTGAIALFASAMPGRVPAPVIRAAILGSATPTASLAGRTVTGGRLNISDALQRSASINLDKDIYGPTQSMTVTVASAAGNSSSQLRDSLTIRVQSTTETTPLNVTLLETGNATGIFQGTVPLASGPAVADQFLQVSHGDQITASIPGLSVTDVASVDALPPSLSGINLSSTGSTASVSWSTSKPSSGIVRFGRTADALDRSTSITALALSQNTTLHALDTAASYFLQIEATDANGNTVISDVRTFNTLAPAPILLVDDDQGANLDSSFKAALAANSLTFNDWNVFAGSRLPTANNLAAYQLVIWNTGADFEAPGAGLSADEQTAIAAYLDAGGRIFISGQDILYNGVSTDFLQNYLRIASYVEDTIDGDHTETGVPGSQITDGLTLSTTVPSGYPFLLADAVEPVPGANGLLLHNQPSVSPIWSGVSYHGNYAAGGFGMVFTTLPFESISATAPQPNNAAEFLRRVVQFLNADIRPGIVVTPAASAITSETGTTSSFSLVLTSQPSGNVTIPLTSSASGEGIVAENAVVFTSANWNIPQTVIVSGVDDFVDDGDVSWLALTGPAVSSDPGYNGLDAANVTFTNLDDDTAGITVSSLSGSSTSESGASVSFTVRLNSQPISPVSLAVNSGDATEGAALPGLLVFTPTNWSQSQTVVITGVDDTIWDGDVTYSIAIAAATSLDPLYDGINPADYSLSNLDNDSPPPTKFYAVDDGSTDRTFEYDAAGNLIEHYVVSTENSAPRGVAVTAAADRLWVIDASRKVYVYDTSGNLLGSWTAALPYNVVDVQGIATDGTNIWVVDRRSDRVYYYPGGALRLSGSQTSSTNWSLTRRNADASDMVYGSQNGEAYLWVVNNGIQDSVFRYTLNATGGMTTFVSWTLDPSNSQPTGITLDPSDETMDIWVADNVQGRVYRYGNGRTAATPVVSSSFALAVASGNANIQGIADPPPPARESRLPGYQLGASAGGAAQITTQTTAPATSAAAAVSARRSSPASSAETLVLGLVIPVADRRPTAPHVRSKDTSHSAARTGSTAFPPADKASRSTALDLFTNQSELDLLLAAL
jgi:subtilisin family serine protease